jgi:hypothetical protein
MPIKTKSFLICVSLRSSAAKIPASQAQSFQQARLGGEPFQHPEIVLEFGDTVCR